MQEINILINTKATSEAPLKATYHNQIQIAADLKNLLHCCFKRSQFLCLMVYVQSSLAFLDSS